MKNPRAIISIIAILFFASLPVFFMTQLTEKPRNAEMPPPPKAITKEAVNSGFVGAQACKKCHLKESDQWKGSHHDLAMQHATPGTVLGNFQNATFEYYGEVSTFSRKDKEFWVNTTGPDGALHDYQIKYTYGFDPLQQYLIEFPDGRLQALSIAWDTRPEAEGGQRWYHLYPDEHVHSKDPLHWTRMYQNWNHMCAECHSTEVKKNFKTDNNAFKTTWAEINVACETCHGPGAKHVAWADAVQKGTTATAGNFGLALSLKDHSGGAWVMDEATGIAKRSATLESRVQEESCARCHSRRGMLTEDYIYGKPLLDTHRLALIEDPLYYPDGQIKDEDYEYGSFLQSKMHHAGVRCSDCHDPHSLRLKLPGDMVCTQCHLQTKFATPEHHHHADASSGASCIACHMPTTTYMGVDARHDHSFRIPRPDLSIDLGVPNACTQCHDDHTNEWTRDAIAQWYPPKEQPKHFAYTFAAAWKGDPRVLPDIIAIAGNKELPDIIRASALPLLQGIYNELSIPVLIASIQHENPILRLASVEALSLMPPQERVSVLLPLVHDDVLAVRTAAARHMAALPTELLPQEDAEDFKKATAEYLATEAVNSERASSHMNLGVYYLEKGNAQKAETSYKTAIRLEPDFVQAYVNLADLYREQGRDEEGRTLLEMAIAQYDMPILRHSLGMIYTRLGQSDKALETFKIASERETLDPTFAYTYGIALNSTGDIQGALRVLGENLNKHPYHYETLFALLSINREIGNAPDAKHYAEEILKLWPDEPNALAMAG